MKAGIVIDDWKLEIFEKRLIEAGFRYSIGDGITKDSKTISVRFRTNEGKKLKRLVSDCQEECKNSKG